MKEKLTLLTIWSITLAFVVVSICAFAFTEKEPTTAPLPMESMVTQQTPEKPHNTIEKVENNTISSVTSSKENVDTNMSTIEDNDYVDDSMVARNLWNYLRDLGYSEVVAAGIIGNFVAEVGDPSTKDSNFDLDWRSNTGNEIGLCQWMGTRKDAIISRYGNQPSCEEQIEFMYNELTGTNGVTRQVTEAQYQLIINASTPEDAAYYFALYFERCGSGSYHARQFKAKQAYNYFVLGQ